MEQYRDAEGDIVQVVRWDGELHPPIPKEYWVEYRQGRFFMILRGVRGKELQKGDYIVRDRRGMYTVVSPEAFDYERV